MTILAVGDSATCHACACGGGVHHHGGAGHGQRQAPPTAAETVEGLIAEVQGMRTTVDQLARARGITLHPKAGDTVHEGQLAALYLTPAKPDGTPGELLGELTSERHHAEQTFMPVVEYFAGQDESPSAVLAALRSRVGALRERLTHVTVPTAERQRLERELRDAEEALRVAEADIEDRDGDARVIGSSAGTSGAGCPRQYRRTCSTSVGGTSRRGKS